MAGVTVPDLLGKPDIDNMSQFGSTDLKKINL
jgi:hypothetical protein